MQPLYTASVLAALEIRKARNADFAALPTAQREAHNRLLMDQEQTRHLHRVRARAAYMSGRPAPKPRRHRNEAPKASRQYATISTDAARDPRLGAGSVKLLTLLAALAGSEGFTDARNGSLAGAIKVDPSTIKRYIAELEQFGYLTREMRYNARGSMICRRVHLTDQVWPEWHRHRQNSHGVCKLRPALPVTHKAKKEESRRDISAKGGASGTSGHGNDTIPQRRVDRPPDKPQN